MIGRARLPFGFAFSELRVGQFYVKCADDGVDLDGIAILQERDRPADGGFRPDMADAEAAGRAPEPAAVRPRDRSAPAAPPGSRAFPACRDRRAAPHSGSR